MPTSPAGRSVQSREVPTPPGVEAAAPPAARADASREPAAPPHNSAAPFRPNFLERALILQLLRRAGDPTIAIKAGDTALSTGTPFEVLHTIRIRSRRALYRLLWDPDFWFFEGCARGDIALEGDLLSLLTAVKRRVSLKTRPTRSLRRWWQAALRRQQGRSRRGNVARHYDLGNEFYRLWLDDQLLYTCAYFESETATLEEAQIAKMDLVCRKLRLKPGEEVIEAGCGWGALALHMARHFGVRVRAYNLSREQLAFARQRADQEGLASQVTFVEGDWSDITGSCDAFVSVGMLEHVGPENFREFGRVLSRVMGPSSRALIHAIGQNTEEPLNSWIESRIFPGAQPPTLQQMIGILIPHNLSVVDVENLRPHYARTLHHWAVRFERAVPTIEAMFDAAFVRGWRLYLVSSQSSFEVGSLQLYQMLIAPVDSTALPLTRDDIYRDR